MTASPVQTPAERPGSLVQELLLELEQLPPARGTALGVVQLIDDPDSSAADVAAAVSVDPALTARMMRMANSAYYGLSGRIGSASFAVTVVGFQTVRSLAAMAAAGVAADTDLPPRFWARGAATASGSVLLARRTGADVSRAFCVGILHDLGTALLWRCNRERQAALLARATLTRPAHVLELQEYGATHAGLCADVLGSWSFPEELCLAIGRHHDPPSAGGTPLRRTLQGAIALAGLADGSVRSQDASALACLEAAAVREADVPALVAQVRSEGEQLAAALIA